MRVLINCPLITTSIIAGNFLAEVSLLPTFTLDTIPLQQFAPTSLVALGTFPLLDWFQGALGTFPLLDLILVALGTFPLLDLVIGLGPISTFSIGLFPTKHVSSILVTCPITASSMILSACSFLLNPQSQPVFLVQQLV